MSKNTRRSVATEADVESGRAVFWIPNLRSKVYDVGSPLPVDAIVVSDVEVGEGMEIIPVGTRVTVIQVEIVDDNDVLLGFRYANGTGVCGLQEVRFVAATGTDDRTQQK